MKRHLERLSLYLAIISFFVGEKGARETTDKISRLFERITLQSELASSIC